MLFRSDIALAPFPKANPEREYEAAARDMELVRDVTGTVRTIRAELNISPALKLNVMVRPASGEDAAIIKANEERIRTLARLESLVTDAQAEPPKASASGVARGNEIIETGEKSFDKYEYCYENGIVDYIKEFVGDDAFSSVPVSYTHLDVYKRQH